jgi:hypothetical protein
MGKFLSGTLFGVAAASAVTWFTRRLDFVMVQDQVKQQVQARWDREALDRALTSARMVMVNVRPRRRSTEPEDASGLVDSTELTAADVSPETATIG